MPNELLQCYNKGCGQKYEAESNTDSKVMFLPEPSKGVNLKSLPFQSDACQHHPGEPFFHDAYKGWSCCSKKCTDFTEFLNIKGCTFSKHSNVKPVEPEKPQRSVSNEEVIEVKPIERTCLKRPPLRTEMVTMQPIVAPTLRKQLETTTVQQKKYTDEITIDTPCKNGGCNATYQGPETNQDICTYHPGVPIFHEGLKYWSCCQKKTTDFNTFLNQAGCETGTHCWIKKGDDSKNVQCRWDFHQTGTHVVVSIYAKQYCPDASIVQLNPIRLYTKLVFPQQPGQDFILDLELCGIINVSQSKVSMFGTKVEINMRKAEPCNWSTLEVSKRNESKSDELTPKVEGVDLSDL